VNVLHHRLKVGVEMNPHGQHDFDMRFTFVVAGWPGLVRDMRVFNNVQNKYGDKFPHPPPGILVIHAITLIISTYFHIFSYHIIIV
jgi:hypothetical protein